MNEPVCTDGFAHLCAPCKMRAQYGRLALLLRQANWEENRYDQELWLWDSESLAALNTGGPVADFWWLDKDHLLFTRPSHATAPVRKGHTQLYLLPLAGGEQAREALLLPGQAEELFSLPGGRLLYLARDLDGTLPHGAQERDRADYEVIDQLPFWEEGGGFLRRRRLWLWENGALQSLGPRGLDVEEVCLSQDGSQLFFTAPVPGAALPCHQLYRLDTQSLACESLPLPSHRFACHALCPAPPGRLLVFGSGMERFGLHQNGGFYLLDLDTLCYQTLYDGGMHTCWSSVSCDTVPGTGAQLVFHQARAWFISTQRGDARLFSLGLQNGDIRPEGPEQGNVTQLVRMESDLYHIAQRGLGGAELYRLEGESERRLSRWNQSFAARHALHMPEALPTRLPLGIELDGWVLRPSGWQAGQRYPAVLMLHGGPKNVWGTVLHHEMQALAARGYAVLFCNPRGSCGRGNAFADIRGRWGSVDSEDVLAFLDAALARHPWIDPARLGVVGDSYGGFLVNWLLGHTTRFAAAVSRRGIALWASMAALSDIGPFFAPDQAADPWQDPTAAFALSPVRYAAQAQTPTLFLHGNGDLRCPAAESLQMYAALKRRGVPCRLCLFQGEGHGISRSGLPRHRAAWLEETAAWLDRWLDVRGRTGL